MVYGKSGLVIVSEIDYQTSLDKEQINPQGFCLELVPSSQVQRPLPLTPLHQFYPSYMPRNINEDTPNALLACALPLLNMIPSLTCFNAKDDHQFLYDKLTHEVKSFEQAAQKRLYTTNTILAARYALCVLIDEIMDHQQRQAGKPALSMLKKIFQHDQQGEQGFFTLLARMIADHKPPIDLLELFYVCLSFGLTGHYQQMKNGLAKRERIKDDIYSCIMRERGPLSRQLSVRAADLVHDNTTTAVHINTNRPNCKKATRPTALWCLLFTSCLLLLSCYAGFNHILEGYLSALLTLSSHV